ncbi:right-handed parallel beta-helix repeat-containing protein [Segetibacter koreensis]|uniref:right-handed parallel beta-helix repeat-containing protein n=1 Tax=Segetibacter koreensis TaxID=398037 RepID=UPI00037263A5|nr:right-handed parallel beta-helix repeat-containing protein [Segetibacter koreensis]
MKFTFTICFLLVFNVLSHNLHATTYYVSLSGKNANSGTSAGSAWQTIAKVNSKIFKGDTILFQGGSTFPGSLYFDNYDIGTSSKPIVIGSYGSGKATISSDTLYGIFVYNAAGFKINNLIFKGSGRTTNVQAGILFFMEKDSTTHLPYIRIDNVEAYGYRDPGVSIGSWKYKCGYDDVSITNSLLHDNGSAGIKLFAQASYVHKNIYIAHTKVYNNAGIAEQDSSNSGSGILLGNVNGAVVEYCTAYNNGWLHQSPDGGPQGIWTYESNNVVIQFNESHHNKTGNTKDGGGFDLDGGSTNSILQYNYSHDNYGGGFLIAQHAGASLTKNNIIRYNISENDGRKNDYGGIHMWSSNSNGGIQNSEIYNNTVYITASTNATPKAFFIRSGGISGVKVRNNIFQTTGGVWLVNVPYTSTSYYFQGNDYWSTGSAFKILWGSTTYSSLDAWRTAKGQEKVNGNNSGLQTDPLFSDTTTGLTFSDGSQITQLKRYKLKSTSGLINNGLNLATLFGTNVGTRDFWGNSLANKTTFNIGAYQLTTGARPENNTSPEQQNILLNEITLHTFPNPVSSTAIISFALPTSGKATVILYNIEGKIISRMFDGELKAGENKKLLLNAASLPNGSYVLHLQNNNKVLTQKVIVSK